MQITISVGKSLALQSCKNINKPITLTSWNAFPLLLFFKATKTAQKVHYCQTSENALTWRLMPALSIIDGQRTLASETEHFGWSKKYTYLSLCLSLWTDENTNKEAYWKWDQIKNYFYNTHFGYSIIFDKFDCFASFIENNIFAEMRNVFFQLPAQTIAIHAEKSEELQF